MKQKKKEHKIVRDINSHMNPMYIRTAYITMYSETP